MEAVEHFNKCIQQSAWSSTPINTKGSLSPCSSLIREILAEKRRARKRWQQTRFPEDKARLNSITAQ